MTAKIDIDVLKFNKKWGWKLAKNYEQPASTQNLLVLMKKVYYHCLGWKIEITIKEYWHKLYSVLQY